MLLSWASDSRTRILAGITKADGSVGLTQRGEYPEIGTSDHANKQRVLENVLRWNTNIARTIVFHLEVAWWNGVFPETGVVVRLDVEQTLLIVEVPE